MPPKTKPDTAMAPGGYPASFDAPTLPEIPDIDGLSFSDAEKATQREVMSDGVYKLRITPRTYYKPTKEGRPSILWILEFVDHPKAAGVLINSVLPWVPPENIAKDKGLKTGELDTGGLFVLVNLVKATKRPWKGGKIVIQNLINENIGAEFMAEVKKTPHHTRSGEFMNDIERYL